MLCEKAKYKQKRKDKPPFLIVAQNLTFCHSIKEKRTFLHFYQNSIFSLFANHFSIDCILRKTYVLIQAQSKQKLFAFFAKYYLCIICKIHSQSLHFSQNEKALFYFAIRSKSIRYDCTKIKTDRPLQPIDHNAKQSINLCILRKAKQG